MPQSAKSYGFPISFGRLFVRPEDRDAYDLIHFRELEQYGDSERSLLSYPDNWSAEAAAMLGETAAYAAIPEYLTLVEENTVPSWLWRRMGVTMRTTEEPSAQ